MRQFKHATRWVAGAAFVVSTVCAQGADPNAATAAKATPTDAEIIASATAAAPSKVSANAAIVSMKADGTMRTVRKGTNGLACMADEPSTPGPDPMCLDKSSMDWLHALVTHKTPAPGKVGFIYMLAGGTDASNTDPYASKPLPNNHWVKTGPHVMVVGADATFYNQYPKNPDPDTTVPYVMWAGTPYQHLMIPIK